MLRKRTLKRSRNKEHNIIEEDKREEHNKPLEIHFKRHGKLTQINGFILNKRSIQKQSNM